jgi:hypothetical protein
VTSRDVDPQITQIAQKKLATKARGSPKQLQSITALTPFFLFRAVLYFFLLRNLRNLRSSNALFDRSNASAVKDLLQPSQVAAAIEIAVGVDNGPRTAGESREAVKLEVAFQDYGICDVATYFGSDVP